MSFINLSENELARTFRIDLDNRPGLIASTFLSAKYIRKHNSVALGMLRLAANIANKLFLDEYKYHAVFALQRTG